MGLELGMGRRAQMDMQLKAALAADIAWEQGIALEEAVEAKDTDKLG